MGYQRDKDFYTRGVGAIASADRSRARQLHAQRRARKTAEYDQAMADIAGWGGVGGMAPLGAFGRIATDNPGDGAGSGGSGGAGGPSTAPGLVRPGTPIRPTYAGSTSYQGGGARITQGGTLTTGTGTKTPGVVTTNGQKPPQVTGGGNIVDSPLGPSSAPLDIMTAPTWDTSDVVVPDANGMSNKTKLLIAGGILAGLYLYSWSKKK